MGYASKIIDGVHFSLGNSKTGAIPAISLSPCLSCLPDVPCRRDCYAQKAYRRYPLVRGAWVDNAVLARTKPLLYFRAIHTFLQQRHPAYFRWHVAGDIPSQLYLDCMKGVARDFPDTSFLCFTKHHSLDFRHLPSNLHVVFSMWPGWGNTRKRMPRAWMQDGTETRIPSGAIKCQGNCESCTRCWYLSTTNCNVVFTKH